MSLSTHPTRARSSRRLPLIARAMPQLEELESRVVPYALSGDAWPMPQLITISFMPDGTNLGGVTSNMFAVFNAKFGSASSWENQILKGAQWWAQQTNINFSVIADSGADTGSGAYQQGNPTFGDIRIGGFNFNDSTLAMANMPPPVNNYSIAGDIVINTGQTFSLTGGTFDLKTVAAHEMGHALGLNHSATTAAVMYHIYMAAVTSLYSDDIAGIRAIYSGGNARSYDVFNGANNGFTTATNLTSLIDANSTVLETGLDITTTAQKEYFTITAPAATTGTMTVAIQSSGLSMLAPTLTVYNASQTQIGFVSGSGKYGTTLTLNITGVSAGQQFYVKVGGADTTAFGTGAYAMTFAFAGIAPQPVPLPNTQVLNGSPITAGGGQAENAGDDRGKDTAWDTFGLTDDDTRPAVAPAPAVAATAIPSSTPTGYGVPLFNVQASIANPIVGQDLVAATLQAVVLIPAPSIPVATPVPPQSHFGPLGSGGDSNSSEGVLGETLAAQTGLTSNSWREACNACFGDDSFMIDAR